jgi:hypothetical protein
MSKRVIATLIQRSYRSKIERNHNQNRSGILNMSHALRPLVLGGVG